MKNEFLTPQKAAETCERGTQTYEDNDEIVEDTSSLMEYLQQIKSTGEMEELVAKKWSAEAFVRTNVIEGNSIIAQYHIALPIKDNKKLMTTGLHKQFKDRYPELLEMDDENKIGMITQITKMKIGNELK